MRELLQLPDTHRIGIVPGSDTGAFEMAMWTMLGARGVTALAWESFGEGWVTDAVKQLRLEANVMRADYGQLPDLDKVDWSDDVLFTWNGTTSRRARARRRVDPGRPRGPRLRRRDQRGVRLRHSVGQDRCRHLLVAEGARRRGRARRADPRPARGPAAGGVHPRLAAAEGLPPDVEGQARRRRVQGRDDQHPVDARGRGRDLGARMGQGARRPRGPQGALRTPTPRRSTRSSPSATGSAISRSITARARRPRSA